jgi:integrase
MDPQKVTIAFGDNNVHVYRRERSSVWQCSVCLDGENHRTSTRHKNLALASEAAELFFLKQRLAQLLRQNGQTIQQFLGIELAESADPETPVADRRRRIKRGPTFKEVGELFIQEYPILTAGERSAQYINAQERRIRSILGPFFGEMPIADITEADIVRYRQHRMANPRGPGKRRDPNTPNKRDPSKPLSRSTMHMDIVCLRLVLKCAKRHGMITHLPDLSEPYKKSKKVRARPWFSPDEYRQLYEATRERHLAETQDRMREAALDLHDLVLFAGNTGLRPDEMARLQFRDVEIDNQDMDGTEILHIRIAMGKRGFGNCKSMPGAVEPFRRVMRRRDPKPDDLVFPDGHRRLFNKVLSDTGLKHTRDGRTRTLYSLRHTYICMRLIEGADFYALAKNCRTSPEMIRDFYASHIKDLIDVGQLNVRRAPIRKKTPKKTEPAV